MSTIGPTLLTLAHEGSGVWYADGCRAISCSPTSLSRNCAIQVCWATHDRLCRLSTPSGWTHRPAPGRNAGMSKTRCRRSQTKVERWALLFCLLSGLRCGSLESIAWESASQADLAGPLRISPGTEGRRGESGARGRSLCRTCLEGRLPAQGGRRPIERHHRGLEALRRRK